MKTTMVVALRVKISEKSVSRWIWKFNAKIDCIASFIILPLRQFYSYKWKNEKKDWETASYSKTTSCDSKQQKNHHHHSRQFQYSAHSKYAVRIVFNTWIKKNYIHNIHKIYMKRNKSSNEREFWLGRTLCSTFRMLQRQRERQ